jgi:hypothetical protein
MLDVPLWPTVPNRWRYLDARTTAFAMLLWRDDGGARLVPHSNPNPNPKPRRNHQANDRGAPRLSDLTLDLTMTAKNKRNAAARCDSCEEQPQVALRDA